MSIEKPFYRIARPVTLTDNFNSYIFDNRYANDRAVLCRSFKILENDVKRVFEYVEPCDDNRLTYSHRIYELLLRVSTEFEANCKSILQANNYNRKLQRFNIKDYYKINRATKLSEYEVYINIWGEEKKKICPFAEWKSNYALTWYRAYNSVKHNRKTNFKEANLENLIHALAGLYVILHAQFGIYSFNPYNQINFYEDNDDGTIFYGESLFSVRVPNWSEDERYKFDWEILRNKNEPFQIFDFNKN